jgi:hypothetical protein
MRFMKLRWGIILFALIVSASSIAALLLEVGLTFDVCDNSKLVYYPAQIDTNFFQVNPKIDEDFVMWVQGHHFSATPSELMVYNLGLDNLFGTADDNGPWKIYPDNPSQEDFYWADISSGKIALIDSVTNHLKVCKLEGGGCIPSPGQNFIIYSAAR